MLKNFRKHLAALLAMSMALSAVASVSADDSDQTAPLNQAVIITNDKYQGIGDQPQALTYTQDTDEWTLQNSLDVERETEPYVALQVISYGDQAGETNVTVDGSITLTVTGPHGAEGASALRVLGCVSKFGLSA